MGWVAIVALHTHGNFIVLLHGRPDGSPIEAHCPDIEPNMLCHMLIMLGTWLGSNPIECMHTLTCRYQLSCNLGCQDMVTQERNKIGWLFEFCVLTTSRAIWIWTLICGCANVCWRYSAAPLGDQAINTMTLYPTLLHYPGHWGNQFLPYPNNGEQLARKCQV